MKARRCLPRATYATLALLACAAPARYVVVSSDADVPLDSEHRLIPLAPADARSSAAILGLRTTSSVDRYWRERRGERSAVEDALYLVVSGQYAAAEETLRARRREIPEYLQRVLAADLASELREVAVPELMLMYQDAYDAQANDRARTIIKLRIRQLRYGR